MSRVLLLLATTTACSIAEAGGAQETPYRCEGIVAAPQAPDLDPAVLAPWKELASAYDTNLVWAFRVQRLAIADVPRLTTRGAIHLQHQMLRIAQRLDGLRRYDAFYQPAHALVMRQILLVAPPPSAFAELDGSHPNVQAILGPADGIVERATSTCGEGNSVHASYFRGLLAFRPLRTSTARALVAQIVAIDNAGTPHITPVVEGIEMRVGPDGVAACVIQAAPDGRLYPAVHAQIEQHAPFVMRHGDGVTCNRCHRNGEQVGAYDVAEGALADIDRKRNDQVDHLAKQLWKSLDRDITKGWHAVTSAP